MTKDCVNFHSLKDMCKNHNPKICVNVARQLRHGDLTLM